MSPDIGLRACRHAMRFVKSSGDSDVSWKSGALDEIDSVIECLQIFIDRSLKSFSAAFLQFWPPYVMLGIFTENTHRQHMMNRDIIVA